MPEIQTPTIDHYPAPYLSMRKPRWPITPEIHDAVKKIYLTSTGNGEVKGLAAQLNYPRWKISRYAIQMGWIATQKKEPGWSEKEIHILELNAHRHPERIQIKLKSAGFSRSATAIVLKRKRMRMLKNLEGMSAQELASCLGVDAHFVLNAIRGGRLRAERRETRRTALQGGDTWYIKRKDIREYIKECLMEIDIRKVDKWWFVDLLTSKD